MYSSLRFVSCPISAGICPVISLLDKSLHSDGLTYSFESRLRFPIWGMISPDSPRLDQSLSSFGNNYISKTLRSLQTTPEISQQSWEDGLLCPNACHCKITILHSLIMSCFLNRGIVENSTINRSDTFKLVIHFQYHYYPL